MIDHIINIIFMQLGPTKHNVVCDTINLSLLWCILALFGCN